MADDIEKELRVRPELIPSSGGVFEIMADGKLIFSKKKEGRFPKPEEVLSAIHARP